MIVHILEIGEYSDRRTVAVFDEEHLAEAEKYRKWMGGELYSFEMNKLECAIPPEGKSFFVVWIRMDGRILQYDNDSEVLAVYEDGFPVKSQRYTRYGKKLLVACYAKTEAEAITKANEIRLKLLANEIPLEGVIE